MLKRRFGLDADVTEMGSCSQHWARRRTCLPAVQLPMYSSEGFLYEILYVIILRYISSMVIIIIILKNSDVPADLSCLLVLTPLLIQYAYKLCKLNEYWSRHCDYIRRLVLGSFDFSVFCQIGVNNFSLIMSHSMTYWYAMQCCLCWRNYWHSFLAIFISHGDHCCDISEDRQ